MHESPDSSLSEFREIRITVNTKEPDVRIDRFIAYRIRNLSRTRIKSLIEEGLVTLNGLAVKASHLVRYSEEILIRLPGPKPPPLTAEPIPLDISYEDSHLLVVNKPPGMVVHPAFGHYSGTLVNALLYHCQDLPGIGGELRPGLVHRLDKDTSGLLVVAKTEAALAHLSRQFKKKQTERIYRALVWGCLHPAEGRIEAPLGRRRGDRKLFGVVNGGKEAATRYRTLERFSLLSLVELQLETGRTHQIRIHLQHVNHPVFGDPLYGGRNRRLGALTSSERCFIARLFELLPRQALHAGVLGFVHPASGEFIRFESPFPADLGAVYEMLKASR
ncbi:MAG: RluA family pseudouridine synthase [bacterium]